MDSYVTLSYGIVIQEDIEDVRLRILDACRNLMPSHIVDHIEDDDVSDLLDLYLQAKLGLIRPGSNYEDSAAEEWRIYWQKQGDINSKIHCGILDFTSAEETSHIFYAKREYCSDLYVAHSFEIENLYPTEEELREFQQIGLEIGINTEAATYYVSAYYAG
jgi:hypothetical protein